MLIIGSCSGNIYALEKDNGEIIWTQDAHGRTFHGDPILTDSLIFIPTDTRAEGESGPLYCLNQKDGSVVWKKEIYNNSGLGSGIASDVRLDKNFLFGVTTQDKLLSMNASNGETIWSFQSNYDTTNNYWNSPPVVKDTVVYLGGLDSHVYAFKKNSGDLIWKKEIGGWITTYLLLFDSMLYFGASDSTVYSLNLNGEIKNEININAPIVYQMNVNDKNMYVFSGDHQFSGVLNFIAIDKSSNEIIWEMPASFENPWSMKRPYFWKDYVIVGSSAGEVYIVNKYNGFVAGNFQIEGEVRSVGFDDNVLYIGTIDGMIFAVKTDL